MVVWFVTNGSAGEESMELWQLPVLCIAVTCFTVPCLVPSESPANSLPCPLLPLLFSLSFSLLCATPLWPPTSPLSPAEVYPTHVRTTFQGLSSASGKVGAIVADVLFSYVSQRATFFLSAAFGLLGALVTWVFLPGEWVWLAWSQWEAQLRSW
jgi:hypothetical protein